MKRLFYLLIIIIISELGYISYKFNKRFNSSIELGNNSSSQAWVYLCGLTTDFYSQEETQVRNSLNELGKKINIKFVAIRPTNRCSNYDNKLCWPHDTIRQTLQTYKQIISVIGDIHIAGFIGFSNGGFFLNQLAQIIEINKPIISIGSAGYLHNQNVRYAQIKNIIYLLIGKQDKWHYDLAKKFYMQSQQTTLDIKLVEFEGGHYIPIDTLENILIKLIK